MNIPSAGISGYQMINRSVQQIDQAGREIARDPVEQQNAAQAEQTGMLSNTTVNHPSKPVEQSLVSMLEAELGAKAGVKVVAADNERIGTLIDIEV